MDLLAAYQADVDAGEIQSDPDQQAVLKVLNEVLHQISQLGETPIVIPFWRRWRIRQDNVVAWHYPQVLSEDSVIQGVYLWGGVGRGKTYLMDLFFQNLPIKRKKRYHFHRFMREIHEALKASQGCANPLVQVAAKMACEARVLCFDECFVSDITDAMILSGLFHALLDHGVCMVMTSNVPPDDLYRDGLQRARFLPAIDLLNRHHQVIALNGEMDHRLQKLTQTQLYLFPSVEARHQQAFEVIFYQLVPEKHQIQRDSVLSVLGRELPVKAWAEDVAWFEFSVLCEGPRSVHDYIELATSFHAVLVSGVPVFTVEKEASARRFIHLVDELYDRRVKLMLLAAVAIEALYSGDTLAFEFERTQSRLIEMQSDAYLASQHRC